MKKQIVLLMFASLFIIELSFSQVRTGAQKYEVLDPDTAGKIFQNRLNAPDKPKGSPYLQQMFTAAQVENIEQKTYMRYNIFNDEFEFISSRKDTLVLDKIEDFGTVTFLGVNKKYKLTSYTNPKNKLTYGYLIELHEKNGYALYTKENIDFYEEKKARTSLEKDMPARFAKAEDTYFLKNKDKGVSEFPDGKKGLLKLFPEKKTKIETFVKDNKISFSDRADMIRIVDFLATL